MSFCSHCGKTINSGVRFCSNCGKPASQTLSSTSQGRVLSGKAADGAIINAIAQTIFITSASFVNELDRILKAEGSNPFGLVSGLHTIDIKNKINSMLRLDHSKQVRYICLIGNWEEVPIFKVPSPEGVGDGDEYCFTDALYGSPNDYDDSNIFSAIPKYLVGRIPSTNTSIVKRVLFENPGVTDANKSFLFAVSAQCWNVATETIVNQFLSESCASRIELDSSKNIIPQKSVISCPDWSDDKLRMVTKQKIEEKNSVLLFNVHGGLDEPVWVGQCEDDYPKIFDPETIQDFNSSTLVCEACYGGALGYEPKSIVESFFEKGGHSFVGSSTIAYGSPNENIAAADYIALYFLQALSGGESTGEALNIAKTEVAKIDPLYDFIGKKTVLSFNLFGAPWHRRSKTSSVGRSGATQVDIASRLDQIRSRNVSLNLDPDNTLGKIRERYRSSLSERNKRFFIEQDKARNEIKRFKDYEKIIHLFNDWSGNPDDFIMQFLSNQSEEGYALSSQALGYGKSKKTMILLVDFEGKLKKTLTSKGKA